jgi:kumamolisin
MHYRHYALPRIRCSSSAHIASLLLLLVMLAACSGPTTSNPAPQRNPTPAQQSNGFTSFKLGLSDAALNSPIKGPLPDSTPMHVGITFKANQAILNSLKKSDKGTNLEVTAKNLGISDELYQKIRALFGITNAKLKLDGLHTYLTVDAPAGTFAQVFQTRFVQHSFEGRTFFAPTSDPKIPNFIYPSVLAITGLDNFTPPPQLHSVRQTRAHAHVAAPHMPLVCDPALTLQQGMGQIYGFDQLWKQGWNGEGMTFNLVEAGPVSTRELDYFGKCAQFQGKVKLVDVDGGPDPDNPADKYASVEAMMDVELAQALAPAATIMDYQTTFGNIDTLDDFWTNFNDTLHQILADNEKSTPIGSVVSISYGDSEAAVTPNLRMALDQSLELLTSAEGMTVFVSSGDCGAFDSGKWGTLAVDYPASSPFAVSVGGTHMVQNPNGGRPVEEVWADGSNKSKCDNQWGSGGGNSTLYPRPEWQKAPGVNNTYSQNHRQVPDIAALAYPNQVPVYYQAQWLPGGGTSAATPIWAAGLLLVNQGLQPLHLNFPGPQPLYIAATDTSDQPYYDVTKGQNGYFPATVGWDYSTGLGTPNLAGLYKALLLTLPQQLGIV